MPRRKPDSVNELRYEFSLGPKEQPLVEEITKTVKNVNTVTTIAAVGYPLGLAAIGWGLFEGMKYLGAGVANIGAGFEPAEVMKNAYDQTTLGKMANYAEEKISYEGVNKQTGEPYTDEEIKIKRYLRAIPILGPILVARELISGEPIPIDTSKQKSLLEQWWPF
tara:strand:- start:84 stop:578 length:495 start_codon:yes stop_codon:yes gene_type:complete